MASILKELYYGNIQFGARFYGENTHFKKAALRKSGAYDKLVTLMNDPEKELFEQYCDAQGDMEVIVRYDMFKYALPFGVLLMTEIFMGIAGTNELDED